MLQTIGHELERTTDFVGIWTTIASYARERGYSDSFYLHVPPAGLAGAEPLIHLGGCDLAGQYVAERTFLNDPCVMHGLQSTEPFLMREIGQHRKLSDTERGYCALAEAHNCADGVALPVFGPAGQAGYVELNLAPGHPPLPEEAIREAHWLAQQAHLRICAVTDDRAGRKPLTPREREILEWLAQRGGSVCLNTIRGVSEWISRPFQAAAGIGVARLM